MNQRFLGVVAVMLLGALLLRLRPRPLAWVMVATAVAQVAVWLYAWLAGHGQVLVFTGLMCALWLASAHLFPKADKLRSPGVVSGP